MSQYLEEKQLVVRLSQTLTEKGLLKGTGGNVSVRIKGGSAMAITPSNFDYMKMTPEDICVVDLDLRPIEGERKPSVESALHAAVYQVRPEVNVVLHTHQVYASACALIKKSIPALFDEQVRFLGRSVEMTPYGLSGTGWLKKNIASRLKNNCNAYLMQNHGALVLAMDPERGLFNVELLEKCAQTYLLAFYTGEKVERIPLPIREIVFSKLRAEQKEKIRSTGG